MFTGGGQHDTGTIESCQDQHKLQTPGDGGTRREI